METLKESIGDFWVGLQLSKSGSETSDAFVPHLRSIVALTLIDVTSAFHLVAAGALGRWLILPFLQGFVDTTIVGSMLVHYALS